MFILTQSTQRARRRNRQSEGNDRRNRARLSDGGFFVGAEGVAHGGADFAEGGVGFYGGVDGRREVVFALSGVAERGKRAINFVLRAFGAKFIQALGLSLSYGFIDLQNLQRFFFGD